MDTAHIHTRMPALIMAGYQDQDNKALWMLHGKPMLSYVLAAVQGSKYISECVVVGPVSIEPYLQGCRRVDGKPDLVDNVNMGLSLFPTARYVLYLSSDIPLLTAAILDTFIQQALDTRADVIYPVILQATHEAMYPDCKRTFGKLREGSFTGGNAWIITNEALANGQPLTQAFIHGRKQIVQLARALGPVTLLRLLTGRLTIRHAEARVSKLLGGLPVAAVVFPHAALGNDLDHMEEKAVFERYLL